MFNDDVYTDFFNAGGMSQGPLANEMARAGALDANTLRTFQGFDKQGRFQGIFKMQYKGGARGKLSSYQTVRVPVVNDLQANATLRRDEWRQLDEAIQRIKDVRLGGVMDLLDRGLTFNLGNAMGTTVLEWHTSSDAMSAQLSMDGATRGPGDRPEFVTNYLPIPIIHSDFEINLRELEASRRLGNPLDTDSVERGTRKVNEKLEDMLFTDTTFAFGGGTIYSYLNHPDRNTVSLSENWDASGKTGSEILTDVLAMKQASIDARHFGPWMLYIPTAYDTVMDDDFDATSPSQGTTIRERIMKVNGIEGIKVVDKMTANNVALVQMSQDVVRLVQGLPTQVVRWSTNGDFITQYKVLRIAVPQIRSDQAGRSGVTHLS